MCKATRLMAESSIPTECMCHERRLYFHRMLTHSQLSAFPPCGKGRSVENSTHTQFSVSNHGRGFQHLPHKISAQRHHEMAKLFDFHIIPLSSVNKLADLEKASLASVLSSCVMRMALGREHGGLVPVLTCNDPRQITLFPPLCS